MTYDLYIISDGNDYKYGSYASVSLAQTAALAIRTAGYATIEATAGNPIRRIFPYHGIRLLEVRSVNS